MAPLFPSDILRRLRETQRVLLAPLQYDSAEAWQQDAARHVQALMSADHAYAFMPAAEGLALSGSDLPPGFFEGLRASFRGLRDGHFLFDDPMPLQMHLQRTRGGAGVYHELDLADRSTIEQSPAHQTLFRPYGIEYAVGLSVPLPAGEAALCVGFESAGAPGYDPDVGQRLQLLVPAFEAGIEQWRRLAPIQSRFAALIDTLSAAVVLVDADGSERYANRAFRALLAAEPDAETLRTAVRHLAGEARTGDDAPIIARHELSLREGTYRVRVGHTPPELFAGAGTVVVVERVSPYPPPSALQKQLGLTPREAEVALLLAEGRSNDHVADRLHISPHTVRHHVEKVLRKLGCDSRAGVAHVLLSRPDAT